MGVSKNAYYNWLKTKDYTREKASKTILMNEIRIIFQESKEIYGSYRVQKQLKRQGLLYSRAYVALLMKKMGLKSILKRKFVNTTDSNHSLPIVNNHLARDFKATKLGQKWVSDITYIRVNDQWNYLTTILDLADRKIVGWSLSEDMTTQNTVLKAWLVARNNRKICDGIIFHSDRGIQYASNKTKTILGKNTKVIQSMSRKGNCWDNAVAESFFKTIKYECLYRYYFQSYGQLYKCIEEYILWYNTKRLHSSLGYITPLEKEIELRNVNEKVA